MQRAATLDTAARFGTEAAFGFTILLFTINLTETSFFRSTDFAQATMTFVTIFLFSSSSPYAPARALKGTMPHAREATQGARALRQRDPAGPGVEGAGGLRGRAGLPYP
jgi:hypothetical protein